MILYLLLVRVFEEIINKIIVQKDRTNYSVPCTEAEGVAVVWLGIRIFGPAV